MGEQLSKSGNVIPFSIVGCLLEIPVLGPISYSCSDAIRSLSGIHQSETNNSFHIGTTVPSDSNAF
jgi:hypothetical protein